MTSTPSIWPSSADVAGGQADVGIGRGGTAQPAHVGVHQSSPQRPRAGHHRERQVAAGGEVPGDVDQPGRAPEEPVGQVGAAGGQLLAPLAFDQNTHRSFLCSLLATPEY